MLALQWTLPRHEHIKLLCAAAAVITNTGKVHNLEYILHARIPLVKFEFTPQGSDTSLSCDLSIATPASMFKSDLMRLLVSLDARVVELYHLAKAWAKEHGLNDARMGTLNSWSILQLVSTSCSIAMSDLLEGSLHCQSLAQRSGQPGPLKCLVLAAAFTTK